ncbi:hypothetical protein [Microcoleus sp. PH2017_05_CCC_O_A]|uniref:hypothetical protein n=1 Tax=Microcoleus sp. PH2017_05_CCC_O_A TaxID=2798816 RepID=UPI0025D5F5FA|nr:hypothetical protein [Microcoleus sp. PH2017_05_CCC_O_A]
MLASTPYGVTIKRSETGTCTTSQRRRVMCYFPSKVAAYTNAQAIEYTKGSGADVYWKAVRVNGEYKVITTLGAGVQGRVAEATASISFEQSGNTYQVNVERCVVGLQQHGQNPYCQNPLRYAPVTVVVHPHNTGWFTEFKIIPD